MSDQKKLTTAVGCPVAHNQNVMTAGPRGPQLLQDVWGYQAQTDASRTVDYHIRALRVKLGEDVRQPRFIQTVHGSGYRMRKED